MMHDVHGPGIATCLRTFRNPGRWATMSGFPPAEPHMQDINPIVNAINDLKGRVASLRGYL